MAAKMARYVDGGVIQLDTGASFEPASIPRAATILAIARSIQNTPERGPNRRNVVFHCRSGAPRDVRPVSRCVKEVGEKPEVLDSIRKIESSSFFGGSKLIVLGE